MDDRFDVWAPNADRVRLVVAQGETGETGETADLVEFELSGSDVGWWTLDEDDLPFGEFDEVSYGYRLGDDDQVLPDPRSKRQPEGVHGLSRTFDPDDHEWADEAWTGRQLPGGIVYELHLGTFTPEGTLDAAIDKLDHLLDLGVTHVELMPVNDFNGPANWGYDGVLWYAVHEQYGGPAAYQRFVDACHAAGLAVVQDVVYNHLGPSGNYLPRFGPYVSADSRNTWGDHLNLDGPGSDEVRRYIVDNALMWFHDFHVDGLRLDAVHALRDDSPVHLLQQLSEETDAMSAFLGRPLTLIAESDLNDPKLIKPREAGGYGLQAQWSDDFHHAVHTQLTGETAGYYGDFAPLSALAKVYRDGFFHNGTFSSFRNVKHGFRIDTKTMPTSRLVVSVQNHDQIGNRAEGDRLSHSLSEDQLKVAAVLLLTSPFTPMLFMGEEWAASTPFQFFTSHPERELGEAVREGRFAEFARMGWNRDRVPDPQDPATLERSRLDWSEVEEGRHGRVLSVYRALASLRDEFPQLTDPRFSEVTVEIDEQAGLLFLGRGDLTIVVNFSLADLTVEVDGTALDVVFATSDEIGLDGDDLTLPRHSAVILQPTEALDLLTDDED